MSMPVVDAPSPVPEPLPLSLIIPVRDEEASIVALMDSIDRQERRPAEVVFVDGGSEDATVRLVRRRAVLDPTYRIVEAGPAGPGRGRNIGVAHASYAWLAMTDAGITLDPAWLRCLWEAHLADPAAQIVYGSYEFDVRSFFESCAAVAYGDPKRVTPAGPLRGPVVISLLVHRRAFEAVGGFVDARSGEDEIFVRAVESHGIAVAWSPAAVVHWRLRPDLYSTLERFRSYSYHYVLAGQQRHWHVPLARSYVPVLAGLLASYRSRRWLALPAVTVAARVGARVRRHRYDMPALRRPGPVRLLLIAFLVVATDAATAVGWLQARRRAGSSPSDGTSARRS